MQGGWFAATAIGNYLVGVVGWLWMKLPLWALWSILGWPVCYQQPFVRVMKKLEKVAAD